MITKPKTVKEYLEYFLSHQTRMVHRSVSPGTIITYKQRKKYLEAFLDFTSMQDCKPCDITIHFVREYEMFLILERRLCNNYAMKCIHILDRLMRMAMENGDITTNPVYLFNYHYERDRPIVSLTSREVKKIINLPLNRHLNITRNLFLFGCYTGLSFCDIQAFSYTKNIVPGPDGSEWIFVKRKKNESDTHLPLLPEAKAILEYYYKRLPKKTGQSLNRGLKKIAKKAKLKQHLTTHVARKTFANILHNEHNVPLETVSRMLGHKSIKTTEVHYVKTNVKKIKHDMTGIYFFSPAA